MRFVLLFCLLLTAAIASAAAESDLSVTVSDSQDPVVLGSTVNYVVIVVNNGPGDASNLVLSDALTPNAVFQSLAGPDGWQCTAPKAGASGTISCTIAVLKATGSANFTIVVKPTTAGMLSNTANIGSETTDTHAANNTDYEDTNVVTAPQNPQQRN